MTEKKSIFDNLNNNIPRAPGVVAAVKKLNEMRGKAAAFTIQQENFTQKVKIIESDIARLRAQIDAVLSDAGDPLKLNEELRKKESERQDLQSFINSLDGKAAAFTKAAIPAAEKTLFDAVTVELLQARVSEERELVTLCDMLSEKMEGWNNASHEIYTKFFPDGRNNHGAVHLPVPQRFQSSLIRKMIFQQE